MFGHVSVMLLDVLWMCSMIPMYSGAFQHGQWSIMAHPTWDYPELKLLRWYWLLVLWWCESQCCGCVQNIPLVKV